MSKYPKWMFWKWMSYKQMFLITLILLALDVISQIITTGTVTHIWYFKVG